MIVLIVHTVVQPGTETQMLELVRTMEEHSRQESGCRMYAGHQSIDNPQHFCFYEQYDDEAALQAHRDAPYFKQFVTEGIGAIMVSRKAELFRLASE